MGDRQGAPAATLRPSVPGGVGGMHLCFRRRRGGADRIAYRLDRGYRFGGHVARLALLFDMSFTWAIVGHRRFGREFDIANMTITSLVPCRVWVVR